MDEKGAPKGKMGRNNANENKEENNRTMPATHLASRSTPSNCGVFKIVIIAIYRSLRIVLAVCEDGLESAGWCRIVSIVDFFYFHNKKSPEKCRHLARSSYIKIPYSMKY